MILEIRRDWATRDWVTRHPRKNVRRRVDFNMNLPAASTCLELLLCAVFIVVQVAAHLDKLDCYQEKEQYRCIAGSLESYSLQIKTFPTHKKRRRYPIIKKIILRGCKIRNVHKNSFAHVNKLTWLDLSKNKIKTLDNGLLNKLLGLQYLNLSNNYLHHINARMFRDTKIQVLDLHGNKIHQLHDLFINLNELVNFNVSFNPLKNQIFKPDIFKNVRNIRQINLSGIPLMYVHEGFMSNFVVLKVLHLDTCSLELVPQFVRNNNLKTVEVLSMTSNYITSLDAESLFSLNRLVKLDLSRNQIKKIMIDTFNTLNSLEEINLSDNKLNYISAKMFENTKIAKLNLNNNRFTYLDEKFASDLARSVPSQVEFMADNNPWQCKCQFQITTDIYSNSDKFSRYSLGESPNKCIALKSECIRDLNWGTNVELEYKKQVVKNEKKIGFKF